MCDFGRMQFMRWVTERPVHSLPRVGPGGRVAGSGTSVRCSTGHSALLAIYDCNHIEAKPVTGGCAEVLVATVRSTGHGDQPRFVGGEPGEVGLVRVPLIASPALTRATLTPSSVGPLS